MNKKQIILNGFAAMLLIAAFPIAANDFNAYQLALKTYQEKNAKEMVQVLLKGSPINDSETKDAIVEELEKAEAVCGSYIGYSLIKQSRISDATILLYSQFNYQSCAMFVYQVYYKSKKGWVITQINFDTNPDAILPESLLLKD